jgi:hypothetical protein
MALAYHDHQFVHPAADDRNMLASSPRPARSDPSRRRSGPAVHPADAVFARRRAVAGMLGALLLVGVVVAAPAAGRLLVGIASPMPAARSSPSDASFVLRTVKPGDTLWALAAEIGGPGDIRARVDELVRLNGGSLLRAGDTVRVPAGWAGDQP